MRRTFLIPVKWYVWFMLFAAVVTFVYGIATSDIRVVLGSFLFAGIGGFAYLMHHR